MKLKHMDTPFLNWVQELYQFPDWEAAQEVQIRSKDLGPRTRGHFNWYTGIHISSVAYPYGIEYDNLMVMNTLLHELKHLHQLQTWGFWGYARRVIWEQVIQRKPWAERSWEIEAEEFEKMALDQYVAANPMGVIFR